MDSSPFKGYNFYKQIGLAIRFGLKTTNTDYLWRVLRRSIKHISHKWEKGVGYELTKVS